MKTMSLKIPPQLEAELAARAKREGISKSSLVREAVAQYLVNDPTPPRSSFLAQAEDLAGCVEGPEDLSSNLDHLAYYGS